MFGRKRKRKNLNNYRMRSFKHFSLEELSITPEMIQKAILEAELPEEMKEALLNELPDFVEHVDEATQKIFNPTSVWLEAVQFADYVSQLATHLREDHGDECREEIADRLLLMAESFKDLSEHAMKILDQSERVFKEHGSQQ